MLLTVGLISDTHGLLRPEALAALAGSDAIVHAGDIGAPEILDRLGEIAPVTAVRGNNDSGPWARRVPERATLAIGRVAILVIHDVADLGTVPSAIEVVVAGHSHRPGVRERDGVLFVNPGSAGPRRFTLPVSVAHLHVHGPRVEGRITQLDIPPAGRTRSR